MFAVLLESLNRWLVVNLIYISSPKFVLSQKVAVAILFLQK